MITVGELISMLEDLDPGKSVLVAADPEGNSFDGFYGVGTIWFENDENEPEKGIVLWPDGCEYDTYAEEDMEDEDDE